jgi:hypothetical protein
MQTIIDSSSAPAFVAVGAASAQFAGTMQEGAKYLVVSSTNSWVAVGSNPTAAKAAGSFYLPANTPIVVMSRGTANKVAILQDAAVGNASLALLVG